MTWNSCISLCFITSCSYKYLINQLIKHVSRCICCITDCLSVIQQIHLSLSKDREWLATLSAELAAIHQQNIAYSLQNSIFDAFCKDHHFLNFQTSYIRSITKPMSQKECCKIAISSRSTGTGSREKPVITD